MNATTMANHNHNPNNKNGASAVMQNLLMPAWLRLAFPVEDDTADRRSILHLQDTSSSSSSWFSFPARFLPVEGTVLEEWTKDPASLFNTLLVSIVSLTVCVRLYQAQWSWNRTDSSKPTTVSTSTSPSQQQQQQQQQQLRWLQYKFLSVFWLLRISFWMSGPYFYAAYALKTNHNTQLISQISLVGYAAIAVLGPYLGTISDRYGRKCGTLLATLLYALGSWSTLADSLGLIFLGRALGGVGTSLLSAAPEAWLVSEFNQLQQQQHQLTNRNDSKENNHKDATDTTNTSAKRQSLSIQPPPPPKLNPSFLQQTFGIAYAYDSVCAIGAGQMAGWAAGRSGPTGPFQMSPFFLACGAVVCTVCWKENRAQVIGNNTNDNDNGVSEAVATKNDNHNHGEDDGSQSSSGSSSDDSISDDDTQKAAPPQPRNSNPKVRHTTNTKKPQSIWDDVAVIRNDTRIIFLGGVQACFEGAMYIFVMQWPPTMNRAIQEAYGKAAVTPYGTTFSCFMACCMAGSTVFGMLSKSKSSAKSTALSTSSSLLSSSLEGRTVLLLGLSFLSMVAATVAVATPTVDGSHSRGRLWQLIVSYFLFEACVGMYFPSIGTLRSKYIPDSHRSVIMTLFGVPLNVIVVTVFLLIHKLGNIGALAVASFTLGLATACMMGLYIAERRSRKKKQVRDRFKKAVRKVQIMKDISNQFRQELAKQRTEHSIMTTIKENRNTFCTFSGPQFF